MSANKKIWWRDYRDRMKQPNVSNMSWEIVFRRVFTKTIGEYLSECSIGGINAIFQKNISPIRRFTATAIFIILFIGIFYFLRYTWFDNLAKPFIVTLETTSYPIRNIDFPAVTLCNFNRISKKALNNFVAQSYQAVVTRNETIEEVSTFYKHLGRLIDHTFYPHLTLNPLLTSFSKYLGNTYNITKIMRRLAPSCEDMILRCAWSAKHVDCNSIFKVYRTSHGHCCAFNAMFHDTTSKSNNTVELQRQISPGSFYGLNVILDPMVDDYVYPLHNMYGFEVLIFDSARIADPTLGGVNQMILQPGSKYNFKVQSTKQIVSSEVKKYSKQTRKCLLHNELNKKSGRFYSYSSCMMNCRMKTMQTLCNCVPYYLSISPKLGPVCTLDNLKCLDKYREKFYNQYPFDTNNIRGLESEIQNSLFCPDCYPDCETIQHTVRSSIMPYKRYATDQKLFKSRFVSGLNMSKLCFLSVNQATASGVLNRLDVVVYWFEIFSNIGGYCGILVGLSIISAVELLYFFIFKFIYNYINVFLY